MSTPPFLRWAGSKRALLPQIREWLPAQWNCYHEPFLGSGALYFSISPCRAFLSDANNRLTVTFAAIQSDLAAVLTSLRLYASAYEQHGAAFYYHVRDTIDPDTMEGPELAAWVIFMNKAGFNGLWRVNSSGKYNVPAGKFASPPTICDEKTLQACKAALGPATIMNCDFRETERRACPGDFVYFDSPYAPTSDTADFTAYTKDRFGPAEQRTLRDMAARLKKKNVSVVLSNADTPEIRALYEGWEIREISRGGGINSDAEKRGRVAELLIR